MLTLAEVKPQLLTVYNRRRSDWILIRVGAVGSWSTGVEKESGGSTRKKWQDCLSLSDKGDNHNRGATSGEIGSIGLISFVGGPI